MVFQWTNSPTEFPAIFDSFLTGAVYITNVPVQGRRVGGGGWVTALQKNLLVA